MYSKIIIIVNLNIPITQYIVRNYEWFEIELN